MISAKWRPFSPEKPHPCFYYLCYTASRIYIDGERRLPYTAIRGSIMWWWEEVWGQLHSIKSDDGADAGKYPILATIGYSYTLLLWHRQSSSYQAFCFCFRMSVRHLLTTSAYHWRALYTTKLFRFQRVNSRLRAENYNIHERCCCCCHIIERKRDNKRSPASKPVRQEMDSVAAWQFGLTPALKGPLQFRTHYTGWHQTTNPPTVPPLSLHSLYYNCRSSSSSSLFDVIECAGHCREREREIEKKTRKIYS